MFNQAKFIGVAMIALTISQNAYAEDQKCTGPGLSALVNVDVSGFRKEKLEASFAKAMGGADAYAYFDGDKLKKITASFSSNAGKADMNFYIQDRNNYLMEYHILQNSNFYAEADSVLLTDEKSFYHVCDDNLLAPAFGGIINEEVYDNMKLVYQMILTEVDSK
ncbi:MAG: hypothetical protein R3D86_00730 [Emcibacteraceae bacterium]